MLGSSAEHDVGEFPVSVSEQRQVQGQESAGSDRRQGPGQYSVGSAGVQEQ
jgi:hypothetical protein